MVLALHPQQTITYEQCHRAIYGHDQHNPSWPAVVRDLVSSLRRPGLPIITIHQEGYMLQMPPDQVTVLPDIQPDTDYPPGDPLDW